VGEAGRDLRALHPQGQPCAGIGSLHTRSWEDRESGRKRFKRVVRADEVLFMDARERGQDEAEAVENLSF
jgi:single-stranded DNA-binding protein